MMTTLVGLGNPGKAYSKTKHNFGFWVLDRYSEKKSLIFKAGKGDYLVAKSNKLCCIKPTTYMNSSGKAMTDYCQYHHDDDVIENLLVIYDDIDLPLGTLRFRSNGGTGGHRGLESIIYHIKSEDFCRLRLGISEENVNVSSEKYVLSPFNDKHVKTVETMIEKACDGIEYFLSHSIDDTMNEYNNNKKGKNE